MPNAMDAFFNGFDRGNDFMQGMADKVTVRNAGNALASGDYGSASAALMRGGMLDAGMGVQRYQQAQQDRQMQMERQAKADEEAKRKQTLEFMVSASTMLKKVYTDGLANGGPEAGQAAIAAAFDKYGSVFSQMGSPEQIAQYRNAIIANPDIIDVIGADAAKELQIVPGKNGSYSVVDTNTGDRTGGWDAPVNPLDQQEQEARIAYLKSGIGLRGAQAERARRMPASGGDGGGEDLAALQAIDDAIARLEGR